MTQKLLIFPWWSYMWLRTVFVSPLCTSCVNSLTMRGMSSTSEVEHLEGNLVMKVESSYMGLSPLFPPLIIILFGWVVCFIYSCFIYLPAYLCTPGVQCLWRSKEGVWFPRARVTTAGSCHVGTGSQIWVLSKC